MSDVLQCGRFIMGTLRESIDQMRAIPALWKHLADPIGDLKRIREDPDYNPWENPQWQVPFKKCCDTCECDLKIPETPE